MSSQHKPIKKNIGNIGTTNQLCYGNNGHTPKTFIRGPVNLHKLAVYKIILQYSSIFRSEGFHWNQALALLKRGFRQLSISSQSGPDLSTVPFFNLHGAKSRPFLAMRCSSWLVKCSKRATATRQNRISAHTSCLPQPHSISHGWSACFLLNACQKMDTLWEFMVT